MKRDGRFTIERGLGVLTARQVAAWIKVHGEPPTGAELALVARCSTLAARDRMRRAARAGFLQVTTRYTRRYVPVRELLPPNLRDFRVK